MVKEAADKNPLKYSLGRLFSLLASTLDTFTRSLIHPACSQLLSYRHTLINARVKDAILKILEKQMTLPKKGLTGCSEVETPASFNKQQVYKVVQSRNGMGKGLER